jgi:hypothetical protein
MFRFDFTSTIFEMFLIYCCKLMLFVLAQHLQQIGCSNAHHSLL